MMENNFNKLFNNTKEHIDTKKYLYRAVKKKNGKTVKDRNNRIELNDATPHKNVILSLAFNIALENYQNIRPNPYVKELESVADVSDLLIRYFSNKLYNRIESINSQNKLIDNNQNYQYLEIDNFRKIEYKLYGTINRFRNYHSHHIHEPGILTFEDFFENDKNLSTEDFNDAKNWFLKRFDDAYNHLTQSLKNRKKKLENNKDISKIEKEENEKKCKEIDTVLEYFEYVHFFNKDKKNISLDGKLFIACMFLYKRQAKIILDKWRKVKRAEGYENTKYTFFTYYCLSERYSLNNYNDNLLKFRDITSKLSTIPYNDNPKLEFVYTKIRELNQESYNAIDKYENEITKYLKKCKRNYKTPDKLHLEKLHNNVDCLKQKIMPIRKRHILTKVLLQYIVDNNLITNDNIKIAIKKTATDIENYYEKNNDILDKTKNLTYLKNQIKNLEKNSDKRKILNEHLKELKRNFTFKTTKELHNLSKPAAIYDEKNKEIIDYAPAKGYGFTLKKKNALLQYEYKKVTANITLSPDLLLKWVFVHITTGKNCFKTINYYVNSYINKFTVVSSNAQKMVNSFKNGFNEGNTTNKIVNKLLPKSLRIDANNINLILKEDIANHIDNRIKNIKTFYTTNQLQPKPWKYESKKKIDTILDFMHFSLLKDVYKNKIYKNYQEKTIEDFIRHKYFNMNTYNIAREYFRFFGRYKTLTRDVKVQEYAIKIIDSLKQEYALCFGYVNTQINNTNSLEELFEAISKTYIKSLKSLKEDINTVDEENLIKILKINPPSTIENVNKLLKEKFYARSFALPAELISIEKECPEAWKNFRIEKEKKINGKEFKYSDFSFIRNQLQNQDEVKTNIDFILQHIIPETGIKKIPNNTFKQLLKLKTEELILWAVAKQYWEKADNARYNLTIEEKNTKNTNYQEYCTFNKVYRKTLEYTITIKPNFWVDKNGEANKEQERFRRIIKQDEEIINKTISFKIKIPAKKYDNKFLGVETKLIKEFCLWNFYDKNKKQITLPEKYPYKKSDKPLKYFNLNEYEDLMYIIYTQLKTSIDDITLLLSSEKKIIDSNKEDLLNILKTKYQTKDSINDFYIAFTNNEKKYKEDTLLWEKFLEKINDTNNKEIIENYIHLYRNFALHYQLQDQHYKKEVEEFLKGFNQIENANNKDFITIEK